LKERVADELDLGPLVHDEAGDGRVQDGHILTGSEQGLLGHLTGEPEDGGIASSGDLGWTCGKCKFAVEDEQGNPQATFGKYVFLWRKIEGEWQVPVNMWSENPEL
jgi:ketosteroid isomerase-like protein